MKLKIKVKDGLGKSLKFIDAETNEEVKIEGVKSVEWKQDKGPGEIVITLIGFELEASGAYKTINSVSVTEVDMPFKQTFVE